MALKKERDESLSDALATEQTVGSTFKTMASEMKLFKEEFKSMMQKRKEKFLMKLKNNRKRLNDFIFCVKRVLCLNLIG